MTYAAADLLALRAVVRNAAEVIAPVWPLKTFIARNPLQGLEAMPFEEAVREGATLFGGRGYLPEAEYRRRRAEGKVDAAPLEAAFAKRLKGLGETLTLAGRAVRVPDLLWTLLVEGAEDGPAPKPGMLAAARDALARFDGTAADHAAWRAEAETVGGWVDRVLGDAGIRATVDRLTAKWCAAFLDEGQAAIPMPGREYGFYAAWKALAAHDPELRAHGKAVAALPAAEDVALLDGLAGLGVAPERRQRVLALHLAALPGWAGLIKWRADQTDYAWQRRYPIDLVQYLAVRVSLERVVTEAALRDRLAWAGEPSSLPEILAAVPAVQAGPAAGEVRLLARAAGLAGLADRDLAGLPTGDLRAFLDLLAGFGPDVRGGVWLEAAEETYRAALCGRLAPEARAILAEDEGEDAGQAGGRPAAQLVFCIDVRSEPFRRALESQGDYQTLGFAGFFGVPIRHEPHSGGEAADLCPVLLKPRHDVTERPACGHAHHHGTEDLRAARFTLSTLKRDVAAAFGLVEAVGAVSAAALAGRTLAPRGFSALVERATGRLAPKPAVLDPTIDLARKDGAEGYWGMTLDEQAFYAEAALRITGLTQGFARLVVLCGHGASTANNPYASALDCGACGGNKGGVNARVMAAILNRPEVRAKLAAQGIAIPADTVFVAGEHDTTTDVVTLFEGPVPTTHAADLQRLNADLARAGDLNRAARMRHMAGAGPLERARDWAQVRPEWGLAGNAAFVVGPRALTAGLDLEGRAFLHSYDWRQDPEGKALEIILTAPLVVAEWINTQYYFSTVDNARYGSGDKATQNVVGLVGTVQGNAGDLLTGLPRQSVLDDEGRPFHEPLRLMAVVMAPVGRVTGIIAQNQILQTLFDNGWVALLVIDPDTGRMLRYGRGRIWADVGSAMPEPVPMPVATAVKSAVAVPA